jgi:glycosyltransferase involved in cell wall biosynthesis
MSDPLVSIVLPTFNGSRYINDSIHSCVEQTYTNWELIIVDDHSNDSTPQIIAEWTRKDPRIRSIRNPSNLRLPASLNRGFAKASGTYLTWTSDDNLYRFSALQRMVTFLEGNLDYGLVYTDFTEIDNSGYHVQNVCAASPGRLAIGNCVRACFLYRKAVAEHVGAYREDLFLVEDWDYWLRIARRFRLEVLHADSYLYRLHSKSLTSTQTAQVRTAVRKLLIEHLPHMQWAGNRNRALGYIKLACFAEEEKDWRKARLYFKMALRLSPITSMWHCRRRALGLMIGDRLANDAIRFTRLMGRRTRRSISRLSTFF